MTEQDNPVEFKVPPLVRLEDMEETKAGLEEVQADLEERLRRLDEAEKISPEIWKMRFTV
jgi:hypothetical protein